jgi:hypothetical protein
LKRIILIVNPVAGGIDKSEIIEAASLLQIRKRLNWRYIPLQGLMTLMGALYDTFKKPGRVIVAGDGNHKIWLNADVVLGYSAGSTNGSNRFKYSKRKRSLYSFPECFCRI